MRRVHDTQRRPGAPDITRIRLNVKSRDDIPAILIGLQDPCGDEGTRKRLFGLPGRLVLPGKSRRACGGLGPRGYGRYVGYPGPIGQCPGLHRPCQAPGGPDRTADPEGRDGPAPREGAPDIRAAHPLDIEGKGRGPGGARRSGPRP